MPWWYCTAQPRRSSLFARAAQRTNRQHELFVCTGCTVHMLANPLCRAAKRSGEHQQLRTQRCGWHASARCAVRNEKESNGQGEHRQIARCLGANLCAPQGWGSRRRWHGGRDRKLSPRGARFVLRPQNKAAKSGTFSWSRKKRRRKNESNSKLEKSTTTAGNSTNWTEREVDEGSISVIRGGGCGCGGANELGLPKRRAAYHVFIIASRLVLEALWWVVYGLAQMDNFWALFFFYGKSVKVLAFLFLTASSIPLG